MTPEKLEAALVAFFGVDFILPAAEELHVNQTTVYRWIAEGATVPGPVIAWVRERKKKQRKQKNGVAV